MDPADPTRVAVGLGANLGDRTASLRSAVEGLRALLEDLRCSPAYETDPEGPEQPRYLNATCTGTTRLTPRQLLSSLLDLERRLGRVRDGRRDQPRVIDLDLLLYGGLVIEEPDLIVPHPRLRERSFVLVPLRDIAAGWRVPASDGAGETTVDRLAEAAASDGVVRTSLNILEAR